MNRPIAGAMLLAGVVLTLNACATTAAQDRMTPTGETVDVPQADDFCAYHPEDTACSH